MVPERRKMADEHEVKLVRLVCEGHDVVEILANQIRPSSVSRVFQVRLTGLRDRGSGKLPCSQID